MAGDRFKHGYQTWEVGNRVCMAAHWCGLVKDVCRKRGVIAVVTDRRNIPAKINDVIPVGYDSELYLTCDGSCEGAEIVRRGIILELVDNLGRRKSPDHQS